MALSLRLLRCFGGWLALAHVEASHNVVNLVGVQSERDQILRDLALLPIQRLDSCDLFQILDRLVHEVTDVIDLGQDFRI